MTINIHMPGMVPARQEELAEGSRGVQKPKNHIFAGDLQLPQDPIDQKRGMARQKALKIVKDAWESDQAIAREVSARRAHYAEMKAQRDEAAEELQYIREDEKAYQELYGVQDDSTEQRELELLKKRQDYENHVGEAPTEEERRLLQEIDKKPHTEYQERALALNERSADVRKLISKASLEMRDDVMDARKILLDKLEFHPMVDAQKTADDIMEAANKEAFGMLVQEGVSHIEKQAEEAKENAEEHTEEKKEKEELKEALELKRMMQEAMIERTREAVDRVKVKLRQQEMPELDFDEMLDLALWNPSFDETKQGLEEMKSKMNLLEADLKGIQVDEEI